MADKKSDKSISFKKDAHKSIIAYADAAFKTHADSKSHSAVIIYQVHGPVNFRSSKQKLVTKSSTEVELAVFDEALNFTMWISVVRRSGILFVDISHCIERNSSKLSPK